MEIVERMDKPDKSFNDYIEIFYRRKRALIVPVLLGLAIAVAVAYTLPPYYRSTTMILIEGQQVPEAYVQSTDTTPLGSRLSTLTQQIMSRTRLEKIAGDFNLYAGAGGGPLNAMLGLMGKGKIDKETMIEQMRSDINIDVIEGGRTRRGGHKDPDAFSISYTGNDPFIAMQITNTLASLFIEENLKIREQYAEGTSEFLINEMNKAKKELEAQEGTLRKFKERHMGSLPEQLDANLRTLDRFQLELQSVRGSLRVAQERRNLLEEQETPPDDEPTSSGALQAELLRLKKGLSGLLSVYKENYPDVIMFKSRIKEVEAQLQETEGGAARGEDGPVAKNLEATPTSSQLTIIESSIENMKTRETNIISQVKRYEERVESTPANEQMLADIQRDYDISLGNYKSLLEKKLNARLAENLEKRQKGERFRIIDPANLPEKPYKPDRRKITLIGALAGAGFGMGLVFLFEFLNPAFRKPEDFYHILETPVLATIPRFITDTGKIRSGKFQIIKG